MSGTVLSASEFDRIRRSVGPSTINDSKTRKKEELKKLSSERYKHWPNTLDALREKKLNYVSQKAHEEELARQEVDRVEAEMRRKQRLALIARANDLMYDQTDKMKGLKGAKMYAEVLKTRGEQVISKQQRKEAEKEYNAQFHQNILKTVSLGEQQEKEKEARLAAKIDIIKRDRREQVLEVRARREAEEAEAHAIGVAMRVRAQEQAQEEIEEQKAKQERIAAGNIATMAANERIKVVRQELAEKEAEAAAIREGEKAEIENRKTALKALEKRRFEKKQESRQKMIDRAVILLAEKKAASNAIETKQADEIRAKENEVIAAKAAKREVERLAIKQSREEQIQAKREKLAKQWDEEDRLVVAQREKSAKEEAAEKEKHAKEHENISRLKAIQYSDAAKKQQRDVEERIIAIEEAKLLKAVGNQDDEKFANIAKSEILRFTKEGKPTYPLIRALEQTQPYLLPARLDSTKRGEGLKKD